MSAEDLSREDLPHGAAVDRRRQEPRIVRALPCLFSPRPDPLLTSIGVAARTQAPPGEPAAPSDLDEHRSQVMQRTPAGVVPSFGFRWRRGRREPPRDVLGMESGEILLFQLAAVFERGEAERAG